MPSELSRLLRVPTPPTGRATEILAERLRSDAAVGRAEAHLRSTDERTLEEQVALARVPAPPFAEGERAKAMVRLMRDSGLVVLETDGVGNVIGHLPGSRPWTAGSMEPPLVVAAHLDTVFPPETPVEIEWDGDLLRGPGVSDDARGLAAILALTRAVGVAGLAFRHPVLVVATVGEEGAGDLRGVRHLFGSEGALHRGCRAFVSLDGAGLRRIVNVGLGSLRYRATVRGPGGHSWVDFGTPNPIHALARALDNLTRVPLSQTPVTTLSIGRWGGGTSVNAIPTEAWVEFEVRSEADVELSRMDLEVRSILDRVAGGPVEPAPGSRLELTVEALGRRPAGGTSGHHPLVQAAMAATVAMGATPELGISSTDANLPMSLGIPAITLGAGGDAGQAHTPHEWFRNTDGPAGLVRALLTLLVADELLSAG